MAELTDAEFQAEVERRKTADKAQASDAKKKDAIANTGRGIVTATVVGVMALATGETSVTPFTVS